MNPTLATSPAPRVLPNARNAFGGIFRLTLHRHLTLKRWLGVLALLALLALFGMAFEGRTQSTSYFTWAIGFYLTFVVPMLAFIFAGGAMRDEMKSTSLDYALTRPVKRTTFLFFKYLSHLACAQVDFLLALGVVVGVGVARNAPGLFAEVPSLVLAQLLLVTAFSAFGFLAAVITSRYIVIGLAYAAIVEAAVGQIPTQLNKLSMTRQVRDLFHSLLQADLTPAATVAAEAIPDASLWGTSAILLSFTVAMVLAGAVVFSLRELSGPSES